MSWRMNSVLLIIVICFSFVALIIFLKRHPQKTYVIDDVGKQDSASAMLSDSQARKFISDVTSNNSATLEVFDAALDNPKSITFEIENEYRAYGYIAHALNVTGRIKEIDWATGEVAVFDYFCALCELDNIKIPDEIEYSLIEKEHEIERGKAPELVAALLRKPINQAGYEILNLNAGDDQYRFLLAPLKAAEKWENAVLGKHIKVEIPRWRLPVDFMANTAIKQRREPRSKLVRHLQKQSERASRDEDWNQLFLDKKQTLINTLEKSNYQEEVSDEFKQAMWIGSDSAIALFDTAAKSLGNNYFVDNFNFKAYALGLYYRMLAPRLQSFGGNRISISSVPTYVMFALIGRLSRQKIWTAYANPKITEILSSQNDQIKKITAQFPLMPLLIEQDNLAEIAHDLLSKAYKFDSRKDPALLYDFMIEDRIKYTRLLPDLHMSIFSSDPFSFLPLEILYVSTLIELPLSEDLIFLRDKLSELPVETDDGIIALEQYLALSGK